MIILVFIIILIAIIASQFKLLGSWITRRMCISLRWLGLCLLLLAMAVWLFVLLSVVRPSF